MSELLGFGSDLPWWGWALMIIGLIAFVSVMAALFFPDWPSDDYTMGFEADPGSDRFVEWTAGFLNSPLFRGGLTLRRLWFGLPRRAQVRHDAVLTCLGGSVSSLVSPVSRSHS